MNNESFNFNSLIQESKDCLLKPKEYFAGMKISGGLTEPIIKTVIYGAVAGVIAFLWSILHLGGVGGGVLGGAVGFMALIWAVVGAIIGLFVGGVIMLVISAICKGNTDFEANARVVAAMMVLMPVNALLGFFGGINLTLGSIVSLLVGLYGIYMMYHALTQALKANEGTSKIVSYILVALIALLMIAGLSAKRATTRYLKKGEGMIENATKDLEKYTKELEKAAKELEKEAEEAEEEVEEAVSDSTSS